MAKKGSAMATNAVIKTAMRDILRENGNEMAIVDLRGEVLSRLGKKQRSDEDSRFAILRQLPPFEVILINGRRIVRLIQR